VGVTVCESGLRDVSLANSMQGATGTPSRQPPVHFVVAPPKFRNYTILNSLLYLKNMRNIQKTVIRLTWHVSAIWRAASDHSFGYKTIIAICVTVISEVWSWSPAPAATDFYQETNTHTSPMSVVSFLQFATSMAPELRIC
jgi:hypothetical protein